MKKILVIRNDKIGDFMLAWPSFSALKKSMPSSHITALVPSYTESLAKLCPWIDQVLIDPTSRGSKKEIKQLISSIKSENFDASICLYSDKHNASLVFKAGIKERFAPATKWVQFFYNRRLKQRRSQSVKPEYEYNLDLIQFYLQKNGVKIRKSSPPYLTFDKKTHDAQKLQLAKKLALDSNIPWCFIHPGTGGSANCLSLNQYAELACSLSKYLPYQFILTAGPGERDKALQLAKLISKNGLKAAVYSDSVDLPDLARSIACANLFIAGSTGPLHIAAALDVPTVGFFPSKRSATPLRWKPVNSEGKHIAFSPPENSDKEIASNLQLIDISQTSVSLIQWLKKRQEMKN